MRIQDQQEQKGGTTNLLSKNKELISYLNKNIDSGKKARRQ